MSQIEIRCVDQTAMFTNLPEIFSGDVNIDTVKFTFDDSWNGYTTKTAVFYNNPKDVYPQILDVNDVAVIPSQVMTKECKLSIGVFGTNANGDVKTSKILTYNVGKGAISDDLQSTATPDFWTQLLTRQINFENNVNSKVDGLETSVNTLDGIVKGRNQALAYNSYSEMITTLNSMSKDELKRGQNIYIGSVGVPDLWVYGVETNKVTYTYTNDTTFINGLNDNVTVQVGYYKLAQLETQKVDIGGINADINGLRSDVETINTNIDNLGANNISIDDTSLALGGTKVQDTLELLNAKINNLQTTLQNSIDGKVGEWKLVGTVTNPNEITLPTSYKELLIVAESISSQYPNTNYSYPICMGIIPKQALSSTLKYYNLTNYGYDNTSDYGRCIIYASTTNLKLAKYYSYKKDLTSGYSTTTVYYR